MRMKLAARLAIPLNKQRSSPHSPYKKLDHKMCFASTTLPAVVSPQKIAIKTTSSSPQS